MTAPITWGGQHLGQYNNVTGAVAGNFCGVQRVLAAGIGLSLNVNNVDYQLQLGYILNFTGVVGTANVGTATTLPPYIPGAWISGQTYMIDQILVNNPSANITTGQVGVFTAVNGGGTTIVSSGAALTNLNAAGVGLQSLTIASGGTNNVFTAANLFYRVTTGQNVTCDVYVIGKVFP